MNGKTALRRQGLGRAVAGLAILNATLGLLAAAWTGGALLLLSLFGLLGGVLAWRGRPGGIVLVLVFHALQLAGYHAYHSGFAWPLRGALSLAFVVHLPSGVLIVNLFAAAMCAASAALLWRGRRPYST